MITCTLFHGHREPFLDVAEVQLFASVLFLFCKLIKRVINLKVSQPLGLMYVKLYRGTSKTATMIVCLTSITRQQ